MNELEKQLLEALLDSCKDSKEQLGYHPTRFLEMLERKEPVITATELVSDDQLSEGFTKLYEKKRLDLSVEAIVLKSPWKQLFSEPILEKARKKLIASNFQPTEWYPNINDS